MRHLQLFSALLVLASSHRAFATPDPTTPGVCSVSYELPTSCAAAQQIPEALSPEYGVYATEQQSCPSCAAHIRMVELPSGDYQLAVSGLTEAVVSDRCDTLVDLAVITIRTSIARCPQPDVPAPMPAALQIGGHAGALFSDDTPQLELGALAAYEFSPSWWLKAGASWLTPTTMNNDLGNNNSRRVEVTGFGLDIDLCRLVFAHLQLCGVGAYQRFTALASSHWATASWAQELLFGAAGHIQTQTIAGLLIDIQPLLLVSPVSHSVREQDAGGTLYNRPRLQAQLRLVLSWGVSAFSARSDSKTAEFGDASATHPRRPNGNL